MKKPLVLLIATFACAANLAFADNHRKSAPSPKSEHELTVGNEKAAGSGAENKSVRQEKIHADKKSAKSEHDLTVGNEKAAGSGNTADDKSIKQQETHTNKGKHKAKGHDKK